MAQGTSVRTKRRRPRASGSGRAKVSLTIDRTALESIQATTDNVSEFVNDAINDRLYLQRLDEELERLDREGVKLDAAGYRRLTGWLERTEKRSKGRK